MVKILFTSLLCSSLALLNPSMASASLMTVQDVTQRDGSLSQKLQEGINNPETQKKLAAFGISPDEARQRVAALSDQEIRDMMNSKSIQAGGDVVIGLTAILLIIIIVILLR